MVPMIWYPYPPGNFMWDKQWVYAFNEGLQIFKNWVGACIRGNVAEILGAAAVLLAALIAWRFLRRFVKG